METIKKIFQLTDTKEVAKALLGHLLVHETKNGLVGGFIVDVECYLGPKDRASHSYGYKNTPRLQAMYDKAGSIYLYTMHTHLLLNLVTQEKGQPEGVMIRGIEPFIGIEQMEQLRGKQGIILSNGPGKLTAALGIERDLYGQSIFTSPLQVKEEKRMPKEILTGPRIGIPNKGEWTTAPLRYYVAGNPYVTGVLKKDIDKNQHGWRNEHEIQ